MMNQICVKNETFRYPTKNHYIEVNKYAEFIGGPSVFVKSTVLVILTTGPIGTPHPW